MPPTPSPRQPDPVSAIAAWFGSTAGRVVIDSEFTAVQQAASERPGQPWLWLAAAGAAHTGDRSVSLRLNGNGFDGPIRCALPLPIASDALGTVVLQHVADVAQDPAELLAECVRVLVPGGRLWLFALNPLAPYRWRWTGDGPAAFEPITWRRRLRAAGLVPEPVSQGLGPRWKIVPSLEPQHGAGLRAAYLLRAEKRMTPLTPMRARPRLRLANGVPAA